MEVQRLLCGVEACGGAGPAAAGVALPLAEAQAAEQRVEEVAAGMERRAARMAALCVAK